MIGHESIPRQDRRFLLLGPAGRGGMAAVWRAFDRVEERLVALKVPFREPRPAGPSHPLAAEFDAWARVRHPNVAEAYELCVAGEGPFPSGTPYLVLEHVDGSPLDRGLAPGRVTPETVERVAVDVLGALSVVHAEGWVHRDVKPSNLLVESSPTGPPRVRLIDFGLASPAGERREIGRVSGSLPWLAPETILALPVDARADLYAVGLVLDLLATGGATPRRDWLRWHLGGPPADPRRARPRFPASLARFVRRLTERDPASRPADAAAALALLGHGAERGDPWPPAARAARAELRLALDAVRLGARRRHRLPAASPVARRLHALARVFAQIHGLGFHPLEGRADAGSLARLVVRAALDARSVAARVARELRLERHLPLVRFGGGYLDDRGRVRAVADSAAADAFASFLLEASDRSRGAVLAARDPTSAIARRLVTRLTEEVARSGRPRPGRGGLLVVLG
jgi:hypothetical protein